MNHTSDSAWATVYNPAILTELRQTCGPFEQHHFDLRVSTGIMHTMIDKMNRSHKPRRAEAVLVVPNPAGQVWLHTKSFYPAGTYRLMTGGLELGEKPLPAAQREVKEETGFSVEIERCLGVITYTFLGVAKPLPFVSYIFLTGPASGNPQPVDAGENISDFLAVPPVELAGTAKKLRALTGEFTDWGVFRAIAHDLAAAALLK